MHTCTIPGLKIAEGEEVKGCGSEALGSQHLHNVNWRQPHELDMFFTL